MWEMEQAGAPILTRTQIMKNKKMRRMEPHTMTAIAQLGNSSLGTGVGAGVVAAVGAIVPGTTARIDVRECLKARQTIQSLHWIIEGGDSRI